MKRLIRYLRNYKKESVFGPLFKLLEASFELIVPLCVAAIIDNGIEKDDRTYVITRVLIMFALSAIGFVCAVTAQYFAAKAATGFATELRSDLFKHIQTLSFSRLDSLGTSKIISRITSDVNTIFSCVNMTLRLFLRSPFIVFGAMICAFFVNAECALVFVVLVVVLSVVVFGIMLISIPIYKKVQGKLEKILLLTGENLNGVRVIRAFSAEKEEIKNFNEENNALFKTQKTSGRISALLNPLTFIIVNAATFILIYSGALKVDEGILTKGEVVALVNYMSQILVELVKLANLIIQITKAFACADRVNEIFDCKSSQEFADITAEKQDSEYAVEFENVSISYHQNGEYALSNLNLKVKKGETIGIIGGTGSGKSTLVNLIPRFYDATCGRILINGLDIKAYSKKDLRSGISIVLQKARLFTGTIRSNLKWGKKDATDEEIMQALKMARAKDFSEEHGGMGAEVCEGAANFSGGQRQRLSIARALLKKPEILILDDSSSALDYATDAALRKEISEYSKGKMTTFIVSQRTASIMNADRIVVLDDGMVAGIGTHEELLKNCEIYKEIYDISMGKSI